MITFFRRLRSVRLIRLEQRSLSVGKNFGLAKTLSRYFVVFYASWPWIIVNKSYFNEKKVNKKQFPSTFLSDLWLDGELHWNSRFYQVTLYFFTVIHLERHWKCPWNLKKCPWKSPWKVLEFFVWQPVLTMGLSFISFQAISWANYDLLPLGP